MNRIYLALAAVVAVGVSPLLIAAGGSTQSSAQEGTTKSAIAGLDQLAEAVRLYEQAAAVLTDNLANADSTAFKRRRARFAQSSTGLTLELERNFEQGRLEVTKKALDLAIDGEGFFGFETLEGGRLYSRDGALHIDENGDLVNSAGLRLASAPNIGGDIDQSLVTFRRDGRMFTTSMDGQASEAGSISLFQFALPAGLKAEVGQQLFSETAASGRAASSPPGQSGLGAVVQGTLEASNVCFAEERIRLLHLEQRQRELVELAK